MVEMACATSAASADCLGHRLNPTSLNGTDSMGRTRSRPLCGTVTAVFEPAWTRCNRGQSGWVLDIATPLFGSRPTHPVWSCRERGRYETRISRQVDIERHSEGDFFTDCRQDRPRNAGTVFGSDASRRL